MNTTLSVSDWVVISTHSLNPRTPGVEAGFPTPAPGMLNNRQNYEASTILGAGQSFVFVSMASAILAASYLVVAKHFEHSIVYEGEPAPHSEYRSFFFLYVTYGVADTAHQPVSAYSSISNSWLPQCWQFQPCFATKLSKSSSFMQPILLYIFVLFIVVIPRLVFYGSLLIICLTTIPPPLIPLSDKCISKLMSG